MAVDFRPVWNHPNMMGVLGVFKKRELLPGTLSGYRVEKAEGIIFK